MSVVESAPREHTTWFLAATSHNYAYIEEHMSRLHGSRNADGATALMKMAEANDAKGVRMLLDLEKTLVDRRGLTALMYAAQAGAVEAVELLVGSENGLQDVLGYTALMYAVVYRHLNIVKILVRYETGIARPHGWTALMDAASCGADEVVPLLLEGEGSLTNEFGTTALMLAAMSGADGCVRLLLAKEARMRDNLGCPALVYAIKANHIPSILLLIREEHAERDNEGKYPSSYASCDSDAVFVVRRYDWHRVNPSRAILMRFTNAWYHLLKGRAGDEEYEMVDALLAFLMDEAYDPNTSADGTGGLERVLGHLHLPLDVMCDICGREQQEHVALPCRHCVVCDVCRSREAACPVCRVCPVSYLALDRPE